MYIIAECTLPVSPCGSASITSGVEGGVAKWNGVGSSETGEVGVASSRGTVSSWPESLGMKSMCFSRSSLVRDSGGGMAVRGGGGRTGGALLTITESQRVGPKGV